MCATPHPKCKKVLGAIAGDIAAISALANIMSGIPSVVGALPAAQAKKDWAKIAGAPKPVANADAALPAAVGKKAETVDGAPTPVAKVLKECSPATADIAAPAKVVAAPAPVTKVPGPFHPTGVVVEIVGTEVGDRGRSCEEHPNNCGKVLAEDMVVRLRKVQIQVEGREEMAIAAYWVTDGIDRCRVEFLLRHMVKQAGCYNGALAQVTHVFNADPACCDTAEHRAFHKNQGCIRSAKQDDDYGASNIVLPCPGS
jgi:hypothetical protein